MRSSILRCLFFLALPACFSQQTADRDFRVTIENPTYANGRGPVVAIDEGHNSIHTSTNGYFAFSQLLRADGYAVGGVAKPFSRSELQEVSILVTANALNSQDLKNWRARPTSSAFAPEEVTAVRDWVRDGGSLLLIVDHPPMPKAAESLAVAFGVQLMDGTAEDRKRNKVHDDALWRSGVMPVDLFRKTDGGLRTHAITSGIDEVGTFSGCALEAPPPLSPILVFGPDWVLLDRNGHQKTITGASQGAVLEFGKGRVGVFCEAAMFTAQTIRDEKLIWKMGLTHPKAKQNSQFVLNLMHWLSRREEKRASL